MYFSIYGKIIYIGKDYIVVESSGIGYQIMVCNPTKYSKDQNVTIFLYRIVKEDDEFFVGFSSLEERDAFLLLISVKGVGPKTALGILDSVSVNSLLTAIASNNISYLRKLPNIGKKQASQILLDLQGTYIATNSNIKQYDEVKNALQIMGFKSKAIDEVLSNINIPNISNEELLKEALKRLRK